MVVAFGNHLCYSFCMFAGRNVCSFACRLGPVALAKRDLEPRSPARASFGGELSPASNTQPRREVQDSPVSLPAACPPWRVAGVSGGKRFAETWRPVGLARMKPVQYAQECSRKSN